MRDRVHACTGASPWPRNLTASSSSAQITTRVLVLPKSSPTASLALLLTLLLSYRSDRSVNAQIQRLCIRPLRLDLAVIHEEILQPICVVLISEHEVDHVILHMFRHDQVVRVRDVYL